MELVTREIEIRLSNEEERTISGIAVPYGQTINAGGIRERFAPGAIENVDGVLLFWRHDEPIGLVTGGTEREEGFVIEAKISDTPRGNEAYTLLRDGVITKMSVGFLPVTDSLDDGVVVRTKVNLKEVSLVPFPAYSEASVLSVREDDPELTKEERKDFHMENTSTEIADLRAAVEEIDRKLVFVTDSVPANAVPMYRSFGEFVHAVAAGDEQAIELTRTYSGVVVADSISKDAWVSDVVRLVDLGRPTINAFRRSPLPADGMNVEWPQVDTNTVDVNEQAAEGDVLNYGQISLTTATSPVKTYGGYTTLSRQVIERSSIGYLDVAFRAMAIAYAKQTNQSAVTALKALSGVGSASAAATAKGWIDAIADSAIHIYSNVGVRPEFILGSPAVYKKVVGLFDSSDRPIVSTPNPNNNIGSSNVVGLTANVGGLPFIVDPALSSGDCFIASSEGFVTYESGGAPFRLAGEDITALTKDFSVYGYAAFAGPVPASIVKITVA